MTIHLRFHDGHRSFGGAENMLCASTLITSPLQHILCARDSALCPALRVRSSAMCVYACKPQDAKRPPLRRPRSMCSNMASKDAAVGVLGDAAALLSSSGAVSDSREDDAASSPSACSLAAPRMAAATWSRAAAARSRSRTNIEVSCAAGTSGSGRGTQRGGPPPVRALCRSSASITAALRPAGGSDFDAPPAAEASRAPPFVREGGSSARPSGRPLRTLLSSRSCRRHKRRWHQNATYKCS